MDFSEDRASWYWDLRMPSLQGLGWRACNGRRFLLGVLHGYLGRVFGWSESRPSSMFYILVPCASCSVGVLLGPAYVGFSTMGMGGPPKFSGSVRVHYESYVGFTLK